MTQICVFNTCLFFLHNTLNYAIHGACLRMVLLSDVYRNLTSLWIKPWECAFKQFKSPVLIVLTYCVHLVEIKTSDWVIYRVFTEEVSTSSNIYFGKTVRKYGNETVKLYVTIYGGSMCFPFVTQRMSMLHSISCHTCSNMWQEMDCSVRSSCDKRGTHGVTAVLWWDINRYWRSVKMFVVFRLSVCDIFLQSIIIVYICLTKYWCMPSCYRDNVIITW